MTSRIDARGIPDDSQPTRNITFEPQIIEGFVSKPVKRTAPDRTGITLATSISEDERGTANRFAGNETRSHKPKSPRGSAESPKPKATTKASQPRTPLEAPDYIDNLVRSISIEGDEYILHWTVGGHDYSRPLPESEINRKHDREVDVLNTDKIYLNREQAITALFVSKIINPTPPLKPKAYVGFWRNDPFPFIYPTIFDEITAPNILAGIEKVDENVRKDAREVEEEFKGFAKGMIVGAVVGGLYGAAQSPKSYRFFDPNPSVPNLRVNTNSSNPTSVPTTRGESIAKAPSASGSESSRPSIAKAPSAGGSESPTRPGASGSTSATPAQRGTTPQSRGTTAPQTAGLSSKGTSIDPSLIAGAGYQTGPGEVLGEITAAKLPPTNTAKSGLDLETEFRAIVEERFPNTQFRYLKSGGPDVEWIGGEDPGFNVGDFKPDTVAKHYEARKQFRLWGVEGWKGRVTPNTFKAATLAYQPDGTLYVRDIAIVNPEGTDYGY